MTDIIFIAFELPPLNIGGVFRPLKFLKYLPENGIRPYVYTLSPEDYANVYTKHNSDPHLAIELQSLGAIVNHVKIDSIWGFYNSRIKRFWNIYFNLYRGNEYKKWEKHLYGQIKKDALVVNFKAVVVTAPPFGMLKLAKKLAGDLKLPLIIDMRDAWTFWNPTGYGTYLHYWFTKRKERKYLMAASRIIATSEQTISDWLKIHPDYLKSKMYCITNGFDVDDDSFLKNNFINTPLSNPTSFVISYVGSFYYSAASRQNMLLPFYKRKGIRKLQYFPRKQDWLYRTPYFFFKALHEMFINSPELKKVVCVKFAGNKQDWLLQMVEEFGLEKNVKFYDFLPHDEAINFQKDADALLLTSAKVYNGRDCFIAGKTFEYFKMQKPILAFVSPGAQKDILKNSGLAIEFNPDDVKESAQKLTSLIINRVHLKPNNDYISQFLRKKLTRKFSELIFDSIEESKGKVNIFTS